MNGCPLPEPSRDWALFLDIDGTLIDIAETPTAVVIPDGLPALLTGLSEIFEHSLAVVSGRSLADIDRLFAPLALPAAGQHGAEIRFPDGTLVPPAQEAADLTPLKPRIKAFVATRPGLLVEEKGQTIAIHYRLAPQQKPELVAFLDELVGERSDNLETIGGHRVFEIKPRAFNKGTAVARFMEAAPFAGRRPVFIGDDRTDEDGFAAARARGGYAIRVGLDGASIADRRIRGPGETRDWLAHVKDALTR